MMKRPRITPQMLASLGLACLTIAVFALLPAGCPSTTTDPNSQVSDGNSTTGTDANDPNGTGGTDPNSPVPDTDSDGVPNATDPDIDGDGTPNSTDDDVDGDGIANVSDSDVDGDGTSNADDTTPAGDGGTGGTDPNNSSGGGTVPPVPVSVVLNEIARTGGMVPDQVAGVTFTGFSNPIIDSQGRVAFWGTYAGTGALGEFGLYIWDTQATPPALRRIIHDDPATAGIVPNRTLPTYFGSKRADFKPLDQPIAWGGGDRLLFACALVDTSTASNRRVGLYRWRASDPNLARVADFEQVSGLFPQVKKASDGTPLFDTTFYLPGISDDGLAVFTATYQYIRENNTFPSGRGVYTSTGTAVSAVYDTFLHQNLAVPEQSAGTLFDQPSLFTTINATGDILFQSLYTGSNDGRGVYLVRNATIFRVIDTRANASWPGLPLGAQVVYDPNAEFAVALGPAGHIGVDGSLTANNATNHAVLLWDPNAASWSTLTGLNATPADALASGVNNSGQAVIIAGGNPFLASGAVQTQLNATLPAQLQGAALTWGAAGAAVSNTSRAVLPYAYTDGSGSGLAFWTSQQLLVAADSKLGTPTGLAQIGVISDPESDRPGRSGTLDDADEFVFRAILSDSSQVIYKAVGQ
jgi:hypothetical protein